MIEQTDDARGRAVAERWCAIAEQRLEHLTELFETGRWRRYHTEQAFLANIQDAKSAALAWRAIVSREAGPDNRPVNLSWMACGEPARRQTSPAPAPPPRARETAVSASVPLPKLEASAPTLAIAVPAKQPPMLDIVTMQERYPLLRGAM